MAELLRIEGLAVPGALRGVWLALAEGETLGVLGESGAGKTALARVVLGLQRATAGEVALAGLARMVMPGLDPWWRVGAALAEAGTAMAVEDALYLVELDASVARRLPAVLSAEEAWRVTLARALMARPKLLILDEPCAGLDHAAQAVRLRLLRAVQRRLPMAWLVLSRDPFPLDWLCERMAVLYLGRVAEQALAGTAPRHPYSLALLEAAPKLDTRQPRAMLRGDAPAPGLVPPGCAFHPRCPLADMECLEREPDLTRVAEGHLVRCHHWKRVAGG